jgi:outer membrane protein assembly factor BamB
MRDLKRYLTLIFLPLLFAPAGLAFEPELLLEVPVEGRRISGDILDGKLILSSQERFWVLTPEGKESYPQDPNSDRANLKPNQGLVASEDGKFFGITTYSKDASPGFLVAKRFELYSADGRKLWEVQNPGASDFYISKGAKLVVGISSGEGSRESRLLVFYNHTGKLISSTKIAFPQGISFSSNGKYLLVNSAKGGLLGFDGSGDLIANFGPCERFAISSDGEYVATISAGNLKFYHQGKPIGNPTKINPLVRGMSFSPENKCLGVIDKKNLYLFEVGTGKLLWHYTLDKPELSFISMDLSSSAEKMITGVDFDKGREVSPKVRHTQGRVYIFDKDGKIIWEKQLSYKLWSAFFPRVQFSSDGKRFCIITKENVYLFKGNGKEK